MGREPLTVRQLRDILNTYDNEEILDGFVLVSLSDESIGPRASSTVGSVGIGFDWEDGQFRIEPSTPVERYGNSKGDVKPAREENDDGIKSYWCVRCANKVAKGDKFCRNCSQRLK